MFKQTLAERLQCPNGDSLLQVSGIQFYAACAAMVSSLQTWIAQITSPLPSSSCPYHDLAREFGQSGLHCLESFNF